MTIDRLRDAVHKRPFEPFILHIADGREVLVKHPDFISISPSGRTVHVFVSEESSEWFDLLLVTSIELRSKPRRNGRRRG